MQVLVTSAQLTFDERRHRVSFTSAVGEGDGVWCGDRPAVGAPYQVELTLPDALELGRNAELSSELRYSLTVSGGVVEIVALVEWAEDGVAGLRLNTDCLFLAELPIGVVKPKQWLRVKVPAERLELWPYDSGAFTVIES